MPAFAGNTVVRVHPAAETVYVPAPVTEDRPPEEPPRGGPHLLTRAAEHAAAAGIIEVAKWILSGGWRCAEKPAR